MIRYTGLVLLSPFLKGGSGWRVILGVVAVVVGTQTVL